MTVSQAAPPDLQTLHDAATGADVACLGGRAVVACKLSLLRRAVIAEMIGRGIEPDEAGISRVADALAPFTVLVAAGGGLSIRDVTGRPASWAITSQLDLMAVEARQADFERRYPRHDYATDPTTPTGD